MTAKISRHFNIAPLVWQLTNEIAKFLFYSKKAPESRIHVHKTIFFPAFFSSWKCEILKFSQGHLGIRPMLDIYSISTRQNGFTWKFVSVLAFSCPNLFVPAPSFWPCFQVFSRKDLAEDSVHLVILIWIFNFHQLISMKWWKMRCGILQIFSSSQRLNWIIIFVTPHNFPN